MTHPQPKYCVSCLLDSVTKSDEIYFNILYNNSQEMFWEWQNVMTVHSLCRQRMKSFVHLASTSQLADTNSQSLTAAISYEDILSSIVHTFLHWKWCWNIPAHYTWKVDEKGFKTAFMMDKLAMINYFEVILEKIKIFFCQKSLWNSGAHYTCMHIILDKIQYFHKELIGTWKDK